MAVLTPFRHLLAALVGAAAVALVAVPGPASAAPPGPPLRCVPVAATGTGQDLGGGQTAATISVGGRQVGTTAATFTITGADGSVVSFVGPIVFTGLGGTLTAQTTGTLDAATGDFTSSSSTLTGTGGLTGVTGAVTLTGQEDLTTGAFTETITGRLCAPPPGHRH